MVLSKTVNGPHTPPHSPALPQREDRQPRKLAAAVLLRLALRRLAERPQEIGVDDPFPVVESAQQLLKRSGASQVSDASRQLKLSSLVGLLETFFSTSGFNSWGSVNTTWKYSTGNRRSIRVSSHWARFVA